MNTAVRVFLLGFFFLVAAAAADAACTMSVTNVAFGPYDVFVSTPVDSDSGRVYVNCTQNVGAATVTIGASATTGRFNPRGMKHTTGTDVLNYNIYTSSARAAIWGDGTSGTSIVQLRRPGGRPAPWAASEILYGRIPAGQNVSAGSYRDNITVTVMP
jgi:spore coat protein U-like protein